MSEYDDIAKGLVYAHLVDRMRFVKDADEQMTQRITTALTAAVAAERVALLDALRDMGHAVLAEQLAERMKRQDESALAAQTTTDAGVKP
jgi:2-oxo-4-hydroxy-4-carboxy--5-ureidoimidazoline (OHCU) decarboxylase